MSIYGENMGGRIQGQKLASTYKPRNQCRHWWCHECCKGVVADTDPVECEHCGGDMSVAPESVRRRIEMEQVE